MPSLIDLVMSTRNQTLRDCRFLLVEGRVPASAFIEEQMRWMEDLVVGQTLIDRLTPSHP